MDKKEAATVLNVGENDSEETVRKAFRRKAKLHHPDIGGAEEAFHKLRLAMDVLLGNDQPKADVGQAMSEFLSAFQTVVGSVKDLLSADLISLTRSRLENIRHEQLTKQATIKNDIKLTNAVLKKLSYTGNTEDVLKSMLLRHIAGSEQALAALTVSIENLDNAILISRQYRFSPDAPKSNFSTGSWTIFTGGY